MYGMQFTTSYCKAYVGVVYVVVITIKSCDNTACLVNIGTPVYYDVHVDLLMHKDAKVKSNDRNYVDFYTRIFMYFHFYGTLQGKCKYLKICG